MLEEWGQWPFGIPGCGEVPEDPEPDEPELEEPDELGVLDDEFEVVELLVVA